ncbi:MAG: cofactor-independent phosphoglycerate mutase [Elusimicrobiota bacterium]|nr:cofactor-independent phosphoglycerate mutase [Elusimicrobiota bacterium]
MKHLIILCDGMADYPVKSLGGRTPLMAAKTPNMDRLAREGASGLFKTIPSDLPAGSEVANLSVMGYDPRENFCQRGVLEAASLGVELSDSQLALRCNLIWAKDNKIASHSGGDLSHEAGAEIIKLLNGKLGGNGVRFYQGIHYRHLLVLDGGDSHIKCWPPHDYIGKDLAELKVAALEERGEKTAERLNRLIADSAAVLAELPLNRADAAPGEKRPTLIWPWAAGEKPKMKTIKELTGLDGAVITAVDLIKGLGIYAGMKVIAVEGATGNSHTNYEGKAAAALEALKKYDYVYLHVEAADEAGHDGDLALKLKVIEDLDSRLVAPIMKGIDAAKTDIRIALLPDHPTPVETGIHVKDPVPVILWGSGVTADAVQEYSEEAAKKGSLGLMDQKAFFNNFFGVKINRIGA